MTRSRLWNLGTVGVVVLLFVAGYFLLISPKQSEAATLREEADAVASENQRTEAEIRSLQEQQKNLLAQYAELDQIAQLIPATPQLPELIRQLTDAGNNASVTVTGIKPGTITSVPGTSGVVYIPLTLTASGTFADVKTFLYELQMNKRAILISDLTVRRDENAAAENTGGPTQLSVDITSRVYMTKETAAAASPSAGATAAPTATGGATPTASATSDSAPAN